ncbi:hypothetical protein MMC14_003191 [Varicellaria rhodocarpa]|nr:hypothetical protein [Varicellaria rhodocarpa]
MADTIYRPRVFLDIQIGTEPVGRIVLELFTDKAPKTCQNFRSICASSHTPPGGSKPLTYKLSPFHRIIDEFMVQGGDITLGDGTGGQSIYGGEFEDENLGWREIDKDGLLCMANRGRGTNSSQFFITLAPCQHLNAKHTVFGYLVSGKETLDKIASMKVDKNDRPLEDVLVSHCGELERRKRPTTHTRPISQNEIMAKPSGSSDRGRKRDHASRSPSRSASKSPPYSHGHRKYRKQEEQPNSLKQHPTTRRRSDVQLDETRRGRTLTRSPSPSTSKQNAKRSPIPPNQRRYPPLHIFDADIQDRDLARGHTIEDPGMKGGKGIAHTDLG